MADKPFMYTDMSERDLLKWQLDYTMPYIIEDFQAIPNNKLGWRPAKKTRPAGHIFGHIIVRERMHVGGAIQGVSDIPTDCGLFLSLTFSDPTEDEVLKSVGEKERLINYWRKVRKQTHEYLDSITDEDLKKVPVNTLVPDDDPNRHNLIREWFVMTIKHQNMGWGEIHIIRRILESNT